MTREEARLIALEHAKKRVKEFLDSIPNTNECIVQYYWKYKKKYAFLGVRLGGRSAQYFDFKVSRLICSILYNLDMNDETKQALHRCNNKKCTNPKHLYVGTHLNNMADLRHSG